MVGDTSFLQVTIIAQSEILHGGGNVVRKGDYFFLEMITKYLGVEKD